MTIYIVLSPKSYVLAWLMPDFRLKMVVSCAQMARVLPFRLLFCLPESAYSQLTFVRNAAGILTFCILMLPPYTARRICCRLGVRHELLSVGRVILSPLHV